MIYNLNVQGPGYIIDASKFLIIFYWFGIVMMKLNTFSDWFGIVMMNLNTFSADQF